MGGVRMNRSQRAFTSYLLTGLTLILFPSGILVAQDEWGPEAVWEPDRTAEFEVFTCRSNSECSIEEYMAEQGASTEAIDFAQRRSFTEFLIDFQEAGMVDLGTIYHPHTNYLLSYEMLNGTPPVVSTQDIGFADEATIPQYAALLAQYPNLMLWPGATSPEVATLANGTQRFIFLYPLLDGCHACDQLGWARLAFDFDANGIFQGITHLDPLPLEEPTPPADRSGTRENPTQREGISRAGLGWVTATCILVVVALGVVMYLRRR